MSLLGDLSGGYSSGGSQQMSNSWSQTDATSARAWSMEAANLAYQRQKELMQAQMDYNSAEAAKAREFNSAEAQKARDFNAEMANTVYTRSVKNMIEAGINPILAANMGLSGANVSSGATASASGASASLGSVPLAQNFMDSSSASQSSGSSWNHSESGLAAGLQAMGSMISSALGALNSAFNLNLNLGNMDETAKNVQKYMDNINTKSLVDAVKEFTTNPGKYTGDAQGQSSGSFNGSGKHYTQRRGISGTF